jgi:hypothetical protein
MGTMTAALGRATDRVYSAFGKPATYTDRLGTITPCTVLEEQDLSRYGETAQVNVKTAVLSVRVADVAAAPRSGETFAVTDGATYRVDSLQSTDAMEHMVFVA